MKFYNIITIIAMIILVYIIRYNYDNLLNNNCIEPYIITKKDHEDINILLFELKKILDSNNIIYWIIGGTLLGSVRHGEIVPWDDDADIGIFEYDLKKLLDLNQELNKKGFEIVKHWKIYKFRFINNKYPFVDIFCYTQSDNKVIMNDQELIEKWPDEYYLMDELFPLKYYQFGNEQYSGPNFPLDYLDRMYWLWEFEGVQTFDHKENEKTSMKIILDIKNPAHKLKPYYFINLNENSNIINIYNKFHNKNIVVQRKNDKHT